jgi:DoxX-like family
VTWITAVHAAPGCLVFIAEHERPPGTARQTLALESLMNVALWIATGLLAAVLLVSTAKMYVPREKIAAMGGAAAQWVLDFSPGALKAIGALEILAAAGLILPAVLDIAPVMVPVTATCVALLFTGAVIVRLRRGERKTIVGDLVYLALAVFVAWGRFGPESFTS